MSDAPSPEQLDLTPQQDAIVVACAALLEWNARKDSEPLRKLLTDYQMLDMLEPDDLWATWLGCVAVLPDHAIDTLLLWGRPDHPKAIQRLEKIVVHEATWTYPELMDVALGLARLHSQGAYDDLVYLAVDTTIREALDPLKKNDLDARAALVHLVHAHGQHLWREEPQDRHSANLLMYGARIMEVDEQRRDNPAYLLRQEEVGLKVLGDLITHGLDLEAGAQADDGTQILGALHAAALHHDDWGGMEVSMKVLMDLGADVGRILEANHGLSDRTLKILSSHPSGRRWSLQKAAEGRPVKTHEESQSRM